MSHVSATRTAAAALPRYFEAFFFSDDFFFDGHQRLIVCKDWNEAHSAAHKSGPAEALEVYLEELSPEEFEARCDLYQQIDPQQKWIVAVTPDA